MEREETLCRNMQTWRQKTPAGVEDPSDHMSGWVYFYVWFSPKAINVIYVYGRQCVSQRGVFVFENLHVFYIEQQEILSL